MGIRYICVHVNFHKYFGLVLIPFGYFKGYLLSENQKKKKQKQQHACFFSYSKAPTSASILAL